MRKLRKLRDLSWDEQAVLCRAAVLLLAAEIGLRLFPFGTLANWVQQSRSSSSATSFPSPERMAWLVAAAARNSWLRPTCLRQSLVLCALLRARGLAARLAIGTTSPREEFQAHAWVVLDGKILGSQDATGYRELVSFERLRARAEIA